MASCEGGRNVGDPGRGAGELDADFVADVLSQNAGNAPRRGLPPLTWPWARLLFTAAAVLAVVLILGLTAGLSFSGDEWSYIVDRRLTFESMLQPHNEHLVFLHVLVYRGMVELLGTSSYLPFLVALMVAHVAMTAGVLVLMRRVVPLEGALAAAVLMLFLGTGFDNLVWAFQVGFVGAAALGVWAMASADRPALAALLLTAALWTQGDGLFYLAPTAVLLGRRWWVVAFPIATYAVWYATVGHGAVTTSGPFLEYALRLTGSVFGGVSGVGWLVGLAVGALIVVGLAIRRPSRFVLAGVIGLASQVAILSISRAHFGPEQAEAPRYIYVAAPFVFLMLSGIRLPRPVWAGVFAVALALNILALPRGVAIYHAFLNYDRSITLEERLAPFR
jgi:hypothetical protein